MSLILKGIDLPKEEILEIEITPTGFVWIDKGEEYYWAKDLAIQIPKGHGRIIDEKELKTKIHDVTLEGGVLHGCIDKTVIHEVPTILEAEE